MRPKPAQNLSPREEFAAFYGFSLPLPPPELEHPLAGYPPENKGGLVKPNPFSVANLPSTGSSYSSPPGGSECNYCCQFTSNPFFCPSPTPMPPQFSRPLSHRVSSAEPTFLVPLDKDELLASFNSRFVHSQVPSFKLMTTPEPPTTPTLTKRPHPIVFPSKQTVPDGRGPSLDPSGVHGSNNRDVVTWFTLKRPSVTSTPYHTLRIVPANFPFSEALVV